MAAPAISASPRETVIITSTGHLSPGTAVLRAGGRILRRLPLINGVEVSIPRAAESALAAWPGLRVTPDASLRVQATTDSTGPHTPSDAFLQQAGATRLASAGDTGQGVTVAVLDTMDFNQSAASLKKPHPYTTVSLSPTRPVDTWNTNLWSGISWNQPPSVSGSWNGTAWNGGDWNGSAWDGSAWDSAAWKGSAWNGSAWNSNAWNGSVWR